MLPYLFFHGKLFSAVQIHPTPASSPQKKEEQKAACNFPFCLLLFFILQLHQVLPDFPGQAEGRGEQLVRKIISVVVGLEAEISGVADLS